MKEMRTIGDLKESGMLTGMYNGLFEYYKAEIADRFIYWDDGDITHKSDSQLKREFLKEDVSVLEKMKGVADEIGFGMLRKGKKYKQLKMICSNLGIELEAK